MNLLIVYSIIIFCSFIVESIFAARWVNIYFLKGIKLYFKEFQYIDKNKFHISNLANAANKSGWLPSIVLKKVDSKVFIRNKIFELKFGFFKSASPILHGHINSSIEENKTVIAGYLNWSYLLFLLLPITLILFYKELNTSITTILIAFISSFVFLLLFTFILYRIDKKKYDSIYNYLLSLSNCL